MVNNASWTKIEFYSFKALAPLVISSISLVIAVWRALLYESFKS